MDFILSFPRSDFRGKLLRLDVDNVPEGKTYGIPPDNPFIDEEGTLPEIYALGFRHPWTITVDPGDPDTGGYFLQYRNGATNLENVNQLIA